MKGGKDRISYAPNRKTPAPRPGKSSSDERTGVLVFGGVI